MTTINTNLDQWDNGQDKEDLKDMLSILLLKIQHQKGATPILITAQEGEIEALKLLIEAGGDIHQADAV